MNTFNIYEEARDYSKINPSETVEYKTYHDNGKLNEHLFYVAGFRHGECKLYHSDGKLHGHHFYVNDEELELYHLKDDSYKSLCIKHTLFNGNLINEDI